MEKENEEGKKMRRRRRLDKGDFNLENYLFIYLCIRAGCFSSLSSLLRCACIFVLFF